MRKIPILIQKLAILKIFWAIFSIFKSPYFRSSSSGIICVYSNTFSSFVLKNFKKDFKYLAKSNHEQTPLQCSLPTFQCPSLEPVNHVADLSTNHRSSGTSAILHDTVMFEVLLTWLIKHRIWLCDKWYTKY